MTLAIEISFDPKGVLETGLGAFSSTDITLPFLSLKTTTIILKLRIGQK